MQECPYCKIEIRIRELRHPGLFEDYRICPNCRGRFTTDGKTKRLQMVFMVGVIASLVFTLFAYFGSPAWLIPATGSYVALGLIIYWGNKRMFFVPYGSNRDKNET